MAPSADARFRVRGAARVRWRRRAGETTYVDRGEPGAGRDVGARPAQRVSGTSPRRNQLRSWRTACFRLGSRVSTLSGSYLRRLSGVLTRPIEGRGWLSNWKSKRLM